MPSSRSRPVPWLEATGQVWKIHVFFALLTAAILLTVPILDPRFAAFLRVSPVALGLIQMASFAGAMLWLAGSMLCASCGGSFAWYFVTHGELASWLVRLRAAPTCPHCGEEPEPGR
ncbi:MAG: hypothetical protein QNK04_07970 [Myxococcota bacterium]|nr:hypothetical protein [Myxococcota bacterium]